MNFELGIESDSFQEIFRIRLTSTIGVTQLQLVRTFPRSGELIRV
jgi:hypothetical protein